jgi:hypothetical protein
VAYVKWGAPAASSYRHVCFCGVLTIEKVNLLWITSNRFLGFLGVTVFKAIPPEQFLMLPGSLKNNKLFLLV